MRAFFCAGPAFGLSFPFGMIGMPLFLCLLFFAAIFFCGWQVTDPHNDLLHFKK